LKVPTGPPVLHHQHAPVLAGPAPDPWPRDVPMDVDRNTQRRRPSHFVDALVPSGDDPPSISPPDVDCCPALPAPDLHCRPRGCDEDASAPRAHPTCSTTPTPIPPAAPPHNNGAPATLGDPPPVATSLLLIVAAATHTSTPPAAPPHNTVAPADHLRPRDRDRHKPPSLLASQGHTTRCPIPPHANAGLILLGHVHHHPTYHHEPFPCHVTRRHFDRLARRFLAVPTQRVRPTTPISG
jgi:hypothetical protein